jgi:hypothetical protein
MQKILVTLVSLISLTASANAATHRESAKNDARAVGAVGIEQSVPMLKSRVLECSVLPYTVDANGTKTEHALISHCADVKVVSPGLAEIKVSGAVFRASLKDSPDADGGDLNDVTLQDVATGESKVYSNVLSYGDVLRGVLGGDTTHVFQKRVTDATALRHDANVLR